MWRPRESPRSSRTLRVSQRFETSRNNFYLTSLNVHFVTGNLKVLSLLTAELFQEVARRTEDELSKSTAIYSLRNGFV